MVLQPITQEHMNGTYSFNYKMARQSHCWQRNDVGMQEKGGVWRSQWDGKYQEETFFKGIYGRR